MKIPYVDYKLYGKALVTPPVLDPSTDIIKSHRDVIRTDSRSSTIVSAFCNHVLAIYNGKYYRRIYVTENMIGCKLGSLTYTKKMGSSIHNSEHNAKKLAKIRKKITQKKIRKPKKLSTLKKTAKKKKKP